MSSVGKFWKYVGGFGPAPIKVIPASNSRRALVAEPGAAYAREARASRAEVKVKRFIFGLRRCYDLNEKTLGLLYVVVLSEQAEKVEDWCSAGLGMGHSLMYTMPRS